MLEALLGSARTNCFAGIDKVLTKDIVPWIPYMWANTVTIISPDVTQWKFDQNAGFTALRARRSEVVRS